MQIDELARLPFSVVAPVAMYSANGSIVDWADGMNMPPNALYKFFGGDSTAVGVQKLPELCVEMQSPVIILWALARFYRLQEAKNIKGVRRGEPTKQIQHLAQVLGEATSFLVRDLQSTTEFQNKNNSKDMASEAIGICLELISILSAQKEMVEAGGK